MSGDVYDCEKCGESIHTSCDCGTPSEYEYKDQIEKLRKGNDILRKMGEFYGNKDNWSYVNQNTQTAMKKDSESNINFTGTFSGKRARQALKEYAELMGKKK